MKKIFYTLIAGTLLFIPNMLFADGGENHAESAAWEVYNSVTDWSIASLTVVGILVVALTLLALIIKTPSEGAKKLMFWGMSVPVILASLFVAGSTVYLNVISVTGGPVHWHADFGIYNCGEEINLIDPTGLSNRVGTPVLHEHDDERIHIEGVVVELQDISLGSFFNVVGGSLTESSLTLPTDNGEVTMTTGEDCGNESIYAGREAELQVFLYKTDQENNTVTQSKLNPSEWASHIITDDPNIPPGDCLIFEFTPEVKNQTNHICDFYQIAIDKNEITPTNF